ncbi:WD40 repeat-like protein [Setomelanomma holmii]|uniref:WD40 repeat-like protein n=1 Tax=Setomelanomma holmii TaxID=210430 RepID=A0A9P4LIM2_9PLEO|nr:WD40 repeat-like protein [Setomelanomma holmii]
MHLLKVENNGKITINTFADNALPPYAILSHTWGADAEEVTFADLAKGEGKAKSGYNKIRFCGKEARHDGLEYFWVDTCCINKSDKVELEWAIRSMFRWYHTAAKCYVYLIDVSIAGNMTEVDWKHAFQSSRWFTRGWTLQELLAPMEVYFYTKQGTKLGDKHSLKSMISQITGIPHRALEGEPLSQFSFDERLRWKGSRETKHKEDAWYSLSGILGVEMAPAYSEGAEEAFSRLKDHVEKRDRCISDLHHTDPEDDKKRIEETNGGLLQDSYHWILTNTAFLQWQNDLHRLLWIKGDPGKGKTMLLCGIIDELRKSIARGEVLSFFFCQETDSRINNATAVLRGLISMLVDQQPLLASHIRKKYDRAGKALFEDANAWIALTEIFSNMLEDPILGKTYLVIDALDECVSDRRKLLNFVATHSSKSDRVRWIASSRNWPDIEEQLAQAVQKSNLSLELNAESIATAVNIFIQHKVDQLAAEKQYSPQLRNSVLQYLTANANETFLWVALVCAELRDTPRWNVLEELESFPPGLGSLYNRMLRHIVASRGAKTCQQVLTSMAIIYRPVTILELVTLVEMLGRHVNDLNSVQHIISTCGSFFVIRDDVIYFVHQSAKDFLMQSPDSVFPNGLEDAHRAMLSKSLTVMSESLHRNMYNLETYGIPIENVTPPDPDPILTLRYSCLHWIDHLYDSKFLSTQVVRSQITALVSNFLEEKYLYWLEALSLCRGMGKGVASLTLLSTLVQTEDEHSLVHLVHDVRQFAMYHKGVIERYPLQVYVSALLFSPKGSLVRQIFQHEEPNEIDIKPSTSKSWNACLQTLEGHSDEISSVACASAQNLARLASASWDKTIKIWNTTTGECLQTLKGHTGKVVCISFSSAQDSTHLASGSWDETAKIWDSNTAACLRTLRGHTDKVVSLAFFSGHRLATASWDRTAKVWDTDKGTCLRTLRGHTDRVESVACLYNQAHRTVLASGSWDKTIKIWRADGTCLRTLAGHADVVSCVAFTPCSVSTPAYLASASHDKTIKIWGINGDCLRTLTGHTARIVSLSVSHDSPQDSTACLASASRDHIIKIWDANSVCQQTISSHSHIVADVLFLPNTAQHLASRLATASHDKTVKIWDTRSGLCLQTLFGHNDKVTQLISSQDGRFLASSAQDETVKIWNLSNGKCKCLYTLAGHTRTVYGVVFSHDSALLASASGDKTIRIWEVRSKAKCARTLIGHTDMVVTVAFAHATKRLASASEDHTIRIWNASSGACLQILNVGQTMTAMSFDTIDSALHTTIGDIAIWDGEILGAPAVVELEEAAFEGTSLSKDGTWVRYKGKDILWIPPEYRPYCSAVIGHLVAVGAASGKVWCCGVRREDFRSE